MYGMKPIKLIISAFGPYAKTMPPIEFDRFEERGLFLIAGDTGAGKTTIFDAVCFALFGTASGNFRDTTCLRSEYASEEAESFVDFYFSHQGKQFHIRRTPQYERKKKRGSGILSVKETAHLYEEGRPPVEGIRPVRERVQALLSIDERQFKQVAMIAQGEFYELLNAKTEARTQILRSIFMTDGYNQLEYKLTDRMNQAKRIREDTQRSIEQYVREIRWDGENAQAEDMLACVEQGSSDTWSVAQLTEVIGGILQQDSERHAAALEKKEKDTKAGIEARTQILAAQRDNAAIERREQLREKKESLAEQAGSMQALAAGLEREKTASHQLKPDYDAYIRAGAAADRAASEASAAKEEAARAKQVLASAGAQKEAAHAEEERIQRLEMQVETIRQDRPKYEERETLLKKQKELQAEQDRALKQLQELKERESQLQTELAEAKTGAQALEGTPVKREQAGQLLERLQKTDAQLGDLLTVQAEALHTCQKDYQEAKKVFLEMDGQLLAAAKVYEEAARRLDFCRAGILASELKEGEKCPVCGSVHHPEPAVLPDESITEEETRRLEQCQKEARSRRDTAYEAVTGARAKLESAEKQVTLQAQEFVSPGNTEEMLAQLRSVQEKQQKKIREQEQVLAGLERQNLRYEQLKAKQRTDEEALEQLRSRLTVMQTDCQQRETALAGTAAQAAALAALPYPSWEEAKLAGNMAYRQAEQKKAAIRRADEAEKAASDRLAQLTAGSEALQEQSRQRRVEQQTFAEALQTHMQAAQIADLAELTGLFRTEMELKETEEKLAKYREDVNLTGLQLASAIEETAGMTLKDLGMLEAEAQQLEKAAEESSRAVSDLEHRMQQNSHILAQIQDLEPQLASSSREYQLTRRLCDLVKGKTGKGKITLEQYVQAAGFDSIIRAANNRLRPMSDGQYELLRRSGELSRQTNTFLDLEVRDNFTGHVRPVGSLSGGESFKASLSLALGLSDKVSADNGGIQMDALFIDEGFGTLDRKSIDNAMDTLVHLSGAGKLVGIISHREELTAAIPQQILVTKDREGSRMDIVTP